VLHRFKRLLKRFQRDERGAFLVLFGVLALVLIATSGAVVDFTQIEQARTRAQNALDAAALGLQPHVFDTSPVWTEADFTAAAKSLLAERLADSSVVSDVTNATINVRNGQLILKARITVPTSFVALVGVNNVSASLISEATRKRLNLEVAMVLDNSGSMSSYSRMTELKKAAKKATDILFDYQTTQPNVFVSIIPFTQYVNVGTANRTASWMSQTGASSVSHLNFDNDERDDTAFTGTVNRWTLYDGFNNEPWDGCVEARVTPFDTTDEIPNNAVPDTMFQPVFGPDVGPGTDLSWESTYYYNNPNNYVESDTSPTCRVAPTWKRVSVKSGCGTNSYTDCSKSASHTYSGTNEYGVAVASAPTSQPANNSAYSYYNTGSCSTTYTSSYNNGSYKNTRTILCTYDFSNKELQERICKYSGQSFDGDGPRSDCPSTALLPLSNLRDTVKGRIDAMVADGSTNIEQGAIWGFHSLSPTEPLTQGRDYDEATSKIMIVMTDGENNVNYQDYSSGNPFGVSAWTAWGYRSNKRLLTESTTPKDSAATSAQVIAEVNKRTVAACASAKAKGVTVYTIGLSAPNATTIQMLKDCATPSKVEGGVTTNYWYFPTDSSQLDDVFEDIAEQLSELRLAQ
jgi:Flp pilus assembly protein TadG